MTATGLYEMVLGTLSSKPGSLIPDWLNYSMYGLSGMAHSTVGYNFIGNVFRAGVETIKAKDLTPNLSWLNKRVDEMRVAL